MIDPQLSGKVVLITGSNHGIGAATAVAFARQGAWVFLTFYRGPSPYTPEKMQSALEAGVGGPVLYNARQQQPIEPLIDEIRSMGASADAWEADLGEPANIPLLFTRCEIAFGPVDILVVNHTHCTLETFDPNQVREEGFPVHLTSTAGIDAHFAINARACALLMEEYLKRYLQRNAGWGRIINLSTDAAHSHPLNISYAASKHAIESYSRSAAVEMGRYGITVNVVAPGPIQTGYITPDLETSINSQTPLGRLGTPEDVAEVIVFLASEQARWLTGQLLYVGGGYRMPL